MASFKRALLLLGALLPAVFGVTGQEPRQTVQTIPGKYIVTFKQGLADAKIESHAAWATELHRRCLDGRSTADGDLPVGIERTYKINQFAGYAGSFDETTIEEIRRHADVCLDPLLMRMGLTYACR